MSCHIQKVAYTHIGAFILLEIGNSSVGICVDRSSSEFVLSADSPSELDYNRKTDSYNYILATQPNYNYY